jgi:hypothetical protein
MFYAIYFILGRLVINCRQKVYRQCINIILVFIRCYLYISNVCIVLLPKYIYIKSYHHRTRDVDYSVYDYWIKSNNKFYKSKLIENNHCNIDDSFKIYHANNMNLINNCSVVNKDGEYIRDITQDIRCFMYYRGLIEWKYILVHLDVENDHSLVMYMNDIDMNERYLRINDIYHEKFNF